MIKTSVKTTRYLAAASLLTVFIIDILTPVQFAVDILYLCCILIVFKQNTKTIISFRTAACLLIIIDVLFFQFKLKPGSSLLFNRLISIFAIVITSYIALHYRKLNQTGMLKERHYLKALEEMLFMVSHKVRKPVANILGLIDTINSDIVNLPASDLKIRCQYLCSSAHELDDIINELNTFIEQTEEQNQAGCTIKPVVMVFTKPLYEVYPKKTILGHIIS